MILSSLHLPLPDFEAATGFELRPEGACREGRCVPLPPEVVSDEDATVDVEVFARRLGIPIARDEARSLYALGPEAGGKVIADARCPEIRLPDLDGEEFVLSSLRGRKVVLVAWASW